MEKIDQWLLRQGLHTEPEYISGTSLLIGRRFTLPPYQVTYRIEADNLIICGFGRTSGSHCQPQQLFHLWGILRGVFIHHPQLKRLRMLVITDTISTRQSVQRRRLQRILLSLGAFFTPYDDGDNWLVLDANKLLYRHIP